MKTKILTLLMLFISIITYAQLRVDPTGRIGMGTNYPNPEFKCHIQGNLLLTTYPIIPPPNVVPVELRMKVGNGWPGVDIGSSNDIIAFWSEYVNYNMLLAQGYYTQSDSTLKTNIQPLQKSLEKILQLKSYSYQIKQDSLENLTSTIGFLAQEVKDILPDVIMTGNGIMLMDYQQIIPLLVEALKEQQMVIDSMKILMSGNQSIRLLNTEDYNQNKIDSITLEINEIKNQMLICCNQKQEQKFETNYNNSSSISSKLFQNRPNPFSEKTIIEFEIVENFDNASIMIFDMQGTLKKTVPIFGVGKGQIIVNGKEFLAGMYMYSLIINGNEIDTKRMILME